MPRHGIAPGAAPPAEAVTLTRSPGPRCSPTPRKAARQSGFPMETVGIEPTSAGALGTASTSVAGALDLASRAPRRQGFGKPAL